MGDMADYYRDNEDCDIYNDEVFNNEYYEHIWVDYQKGKLHWTTKDGKRLLISNMEESHILNTINHLKSKTESNLAVDEWLDVFWAEIKNRNK